MTSDIGCGAKTIPDPKPEHELGKVRSRMEVCDEEMKAESPTCETCVAGNPDKQWVNMKSIVPSSADSSGALPVISTNISDVVFNDKLDHNSSNGVDSSLSLIDLENACDADSAHFLLTTPDKKVPTTHEEQNDFGASPIPFADEMEARVAKTPTSCPQVSSPFHTTHHDDRKRQFSISSTTASPIKPSNVISSTPFHARNQLSSVTEAFEFPANTTYNIDKDEPQADATFSKAANATYDAGIRAAGRPHNATFSAPGHPAPDSGNTVGNSTFNVETRPTAGAARCDTTYDKTEQKCADATFDKAPAPGQCHHTVETICQQFTDSGMAEQGLKPPGQVDRVARHNSTGSDAPNGVAAPTAASSTSSLRQQGKGLRKPLSLVNSSGNVRPKTNNTTTANTADKGKLAKKPGRINPPRMNAAAMSRIQARSPQKNLDPDQQDENAAATSMKPPASATMLRKPQSRKSIAAPRRSLLPPPAAKTRNTSTSSALPRSAGRNASTSSTSASDAGKQGSDAPLTPSKRKADSPKHSAGRTAKFDPNRRDPATSRPGGVTSSSLRTSGIVTSRIASLSNRSSSKLQRPQGSSLPTTQSVTSSTSVSTSVTSISSVGVPRARSAAGKPPKTATKRSRRSPEAKKRPQNQNAQCAVAMATLLDFVVNKLDGLSAPELAASKQCLERLVGEQQQTNTGLSSRVVELESALRESRESHERDVSGLTQKHEGELLAFSETLKDLTERITKQAEEHRNEISTLNEDFTKKIEDLESKHEAEVAQLRLEWTEEREAMERDTEDLRNNMKTRVDQKVEELMQPYRNAYEENKSLRAVLEMKTEELHKTQLEISQQSEQHSEVRTLRDHVISLEQKNEDLTTQLGEKAGEHRSMKQDLDQLRHSLDEQRHLNKSQAQRIEELQYRIASNAPSPASPFNPVFTPSPTNAHPASGVGAGDVFDTPVRKRPFGQNSAVHGNGYSTVTPSRENGDQ